MKEFDVSLRKTCATKKQALFPSWHTESVSERDQNRLDQGTGPLIFEITEHNGDRLRCERITRIDLTVPKLRINEEDDNHRPLSHFEERRIERDLHQTTFNWILCRYPIISLSTIIRLLVPNYI